MNVRIVSLYTILAVVLTACGQSNTYKPVTDQPLNSSNTVATTTTTTEETVKITCVATIEEDAIISNYQSSRLFLRDGMIPFIVSSPCITFDGKSIEGWLRYEVLAQEYDASGEVGDGQSKSYYTYDLGDPEQGLLAEDFINLYHGCLHEFRGTSGLVSRCWEERIVKDYPYLEGSLR